MIRIHSTKLLSTKLPDRMYEIRLNELNSLVSLQRREKASKFIFTEDKVRSLTSEILLRYGLLNELRSNPQNLSFSYNIYGKPILDGIENVDFSISHSGNWVLVGLSEHTIGVDIEKIHNIHIDIAERFFTEEEYKLVKNCFDEKIMINTFYRVWTLKEAYIKAIGKGLSCPLNSFSVIPGMEGVSLKLLNQELPGMFFKEYSFDQEYKCAICCGADSFPAEISTIEFETLISEIKSIF